MQFPRISLVLLPSLVFPSVLVSATPFSTDLNVFNASFAPDPATYRWHHADNHCHRVKTGYKRKQGNPNSKMMADWAFDRALDKMLKGKSWEYSGMSSERCPSMEQISLERGNLPWEEQRCECFVTEKPTAVLGFLTWRFDLRIYGFGDTYRNDTGCGRGIRHYLRARTAKVDIHNFTCVRDSNPNNAYGRRITWYSSKFFHHGGVQPALFQASGMQMGGCGCKDHFAKSRWFTFSFPYFRFQVPNFKGFKSKKDWERHGRPSKPYVIKEINAPDLGRNAYNQPPPPENTTWIAGGGS